MSVLRADILIFKLKKNYVMSSYVLDYENKRFSRNNIRRMVVDKKRLDNCKHTFDILTSFRRM